eukprot:SAG31_NODE_5137_length_2720_cov_1.492560_3_plen_314_part_00
MRNCCCGNDSHCSSSISVHADGHCTATVTGRSGATFIRYTRPGLSPSSRTIHCHPVFVILIQLSARSGMPSRSYLSYMCECPLHYSALVHRCSVSDRMHVGSQVCFTTPVRACFGVSLDVGSIAFYIEMCLDIFFIIDVLVNARTSFYDEHGFREDRPARILSHYLHGWFVIDVISCLPVGYLQYLNIDGLTSAGDQTKAVKVLRLMKLTKMLRLGRLKRILQERQNAHSILIQAGFGILGTLGLISLLSHMMACIFFYIVESCTDGSFDRFSEDWQAIAVESSAPAVPASTEDNVSRHPVTSVGPALDQSPL